MIDRIKSKQPKTCWSVMSNFFSSLSPSRLLIGYLYFSGSILNNFANAQNVVTTTYYSSRNWRTREPSSVCVSAAPGCVLNVQGIFKTGNLDGFVVRQECDENDVSYAGRASLANQIKNGLFHGDNLCDKTIKNTVAKDPINSRYRHNTDYSVNLEKEDRVELTYRPLLSNPSC